MVEMFAVYALLLTGWGLWTKAHTGANVAEPDAADSPAPVAHERGAAARRHLSTLP